MIFHEIWCWEKFSTSNIAAIPSGSFREIIFAVFWQYNLGYLASFLFAKFSLSCILAVVSLFAGKYIFHFIQRFSTLKYLPTEIFPFQNNYIKLKIGSLKYELSIMVSSKSCLQDLFFIILKYLKLNNFISNVKHFQSNFFSWFQRLY